MSKKKNHGKSGVDQTRNYVIGEVGKKKLSHQELDQKLTPFLQGKSDEPKQRPVRYVPAPSRIARARGRVQHSTAQYDFICKRDN